MPLISHEQLSDRLRELQLPVMADELHGVLTGLACAGLTPADTSWAGQLCECLDGGSQPVTDEDITRHREALAALHALCVRDLGEGSFAFQPLLPDDEEFLSVRAHALARWSLGFVRGFAGVTRTLDADDRDVLADITAISHLDRDHDFADPAQEDENERALMELTEYVRMAAIELYSIALQHLPSQESVPPDATRH